jgi:hypothetical protein
MRRFPTGRCTEGSDHFTAEAREFSGGGYQLE